MKFHPLLAAVLFPFSSLAEVKDEIHLQWAICDPNPHIVLQKLDGHDRDPKKQNPITYYDTNPPTHVQQGIMFRTKTHSHQEISLVKVRFAGEAQEIPDLVDCVWDRYGNNTFLTCGMSSPLTEERLWSDEQVGFAENYGSVLWDDLIAFGPYPNSKWKLKIEGRKAVFDDVVAQSRHLMEIEVKVPKSEGADVYRSVTEYLEEHGVLLCDNQDSKTLRLFQALYRSVSSGGGHQSALGPASHGLRRKVKGLDPNCS